MRLLANTEGTPRQFTRPLWAEVSGSALLANYETLRRAAGAQADVLAVVKANAYGHDALLCARVLADAGAVWLGVTSAEEGVAVRAVCPRARILLMSGIFSGEAEAVIEHDLTPVVWEHWQLDLLEGAATARRLPPASIAVHLEIDTGMARQGVRILRSELSAEAAGLLQRFHTGSALALEGVLTHFCEPEHFSSHDPSSQITSFAAAIDALHALGLRPRWLHAGNSSTMLVGPDRQALIDLAARAGARAMLRPGLALYGYLDRFTRDGHPWSGPEVAPVLAWKTQITSLRTLQLGETAGYGHTYAAPGLTQIALLPVGYADGFNRLLSNRGHVLVRGQKAPIAGRVSMDQAMVDVTHIPGAAIGDEVVLLGKQGGQVISAWDLADLAGTVPWEVLCAISARVPRVLVS